MKNKYFSDLPPRAFKGVPAFPDIDNLDRVVSLQAFDHRAASVLVNPENQHRPAQPFPATVEQHEDPAWVPDPQFWVPSAECAWEQSDGWVLGFKEITAPTNVRTMIAALFPLVGFGNKVPLLLPLGEDRREWLLCANFNAVPFDYAARQKVQVGNRVVPRA